MQFRMFLILIVIFYNSPIIANEMTDAVDNACKHIKKCIYDSPEIEGESSKTLMELPSKFCLEVKGGLYSFNKQNEYYGNAIECLNDISTSSCAKLNNPIELVSCEKINAILDKNEESTKPIKLVELKDNRKYDLEIVVIGGKGGWIYTYRDPVRGNIDLPKNNLKLPLKKNIK